MNAERLSADLAHQLEVEDPELMRAVFQRYLQPLDGMAYQVRACRVSRTRYQQALRRYTVHYTLRLAELDTGRELSLLVSGVMHAGGRTREIWERLRRSESGRKNPNAIPTFASFYYIPYPEMLVQVFPYDHLLPALSLLMAGPPPELEPPLLAPFGPGSWKVEAWDAEPVRYLAETRATLRLTVRVRDAAAGRTEERRFYAKVYHDEEIGEQTYQVLRALWDKSSMGGVGFTVGRPVAYLRGLQTVIQEEFTGVSLRDVLLQENEPTPTVRKVARALAALHLDHVATPRRRSIRNVVADLKKKAQFLQWVHPRLRPEIEEIVEAIVAGLEEVAPAPTHCDLGLQHILLKGDHFALVDLDAFAEADPVLDVAKVLSQIHCSLPQERASTATRAFAEEYFAHVPGAWRARLPLHYAGALLKVAAGRSKRHRLGQPPGGGPDKIEALLGKAKDSLAGRIW